jgi:hypothetical protein
MPKVRKFMDGSRDWLGYTIAVGIAILFGFVGRRSNIVMVSLYIIIVIGAVVTWPKSKTFAAALIGSAAIMALSKSLAGLWSSAPTIAAAICAILFAILYWRQL